MKACCPECRKQFKSGDVVFLDELNGLTHQKCYSKVPELIKGVGTYEEIINEHAFFEDLKPLQ